MSKYLIIVFLSICFEMFSQSSKPKLVVGIVVDQMRAEYLYRFQDNYGEDGFVRLMKEGFNVKNCHYNYLPTATGPGHSSIYTGTFPANHGIVGNDWYDRESMQEIYCAEDSSVQLVDEETGNKEMKDYQRSPKNQQSTTITDEIKLFSNGRSKVVGISMKDRGAIFPAGHMADYAFWYNRENGNFISSTYYTNELPKWLIEFNSRKIADSLLAQNWDAYLPIDKYIHSGPDESSIEKRYKGKNNTSFPYNLNKLRKANKDYDLLTEIPFGNSILTKMAKATIEGEKMGVDSETDFLSISYSSTDYVGHNFGIRSKELEDTYVRLDREFAELLQYLDKKVGKGQYLLFVTADHAASDNPEFLKENGLPGEFYNSGAMQKFLEEGLVTQLGDGEYIAYQDKTQIYLNPGLNNKSEVLEEIRILLKDYPGLKKAFIPELDNCLSNSITGEFIKHSYHAQNSGDILLHFNPGWMEKRSYGTTHGNAYSSDTHVPLLWYGWEIASGNTVKPYYITEIAPTLSQLLNIPIPNASDIRVIEEIFE